MCISVECVSWVNCKLKVVQAAIIIFFFTTFTLRKHLAESLIISRLDFSDIVFYPLTEHLLNRLQRIQYSAASFVTGRYVNSIESILKLGWLPMRERRDWHILKAAHKALYSSDCMASLC
jgi:hypothetical protein